MEKEVFLSISLTLLQLTGVARCLLGIVIPNQDQKSKEFEYMKSMVGTKHLALMFLFLLFGAIPAMAQATTNTTSTTTPFQFTIAPSCAGELIEVSGNMHTVTRVTTTPSGQTSTEFHLNLEGSGTGLTTGNHYQFGQETTDIFNDHDSPAIEFTFVEMVRVISSGSDNNFRLRTHIHVTINANGETTVSIMDSERVCD